MVGCGRCGRAHITAKNRHFVETIAVGTSAVHAGRVEAEERVALRRDHNDSAITTEISDIFRDDVGNALSNGF